MTFSREGVCSIDGCYAPIKAKRLCEKHYARQLRYGRIHRVRKTREEYTECMALECDEEAFTNALCEYHYRNYLRTGSPYLPVIIKFCAVPNCDRIHHSRGMCQRHYHQWLKVAEEIQIQPFKDKRPNGKNDAKLMG